MEPYKMTRDEWSWELIINRGYDIDPNQAYDGHRHQVMKALTEGKAVPDRVLNDYPELQESR